MAGKFPITVRKELSPRQHDGVSQGRICFTSQQHASVPQERICFTSQQHASVPQERICSNKCTCCHTETEAADHTYYLTQPQYTDTGTTSPSAHSITPGNWQGSHWSANFCVTGMTRPRKIRAQAGIEPLVCALEAYALTTRSAGLALSRRTP